MLSNDLPQDLMEEIMVRLPVTSLLRFKCVSKSWYALITDNPFIRKHLDWSNSIGKNRRLRLVFGVATSISLIHNRQQPYEIQDIELPIPKTYLTSVLINGQCDGIFCLCGDYDYARVVFLWNPATKEVKTIPTSQWHPKGIYYAKYALGFDPITKDYKIVQFPKLCPLGEKRTTLVQVYNLSTDSWRRLDADDDVSTNPEQFRHSTMGRYLNGAYHWLVGNRSDGTETFIFRFDFSEEAFGTIQRPPGITSSTPMEHNLLAVVDESLGWVVIKHDDSMIDQFGLEIWVMEEYGVERSWIKKLHVRPFTYSYSWYYLQFWRDDEIIVDDDINHQLISLNLRNNQRTEILKCNFRTMVDYVESLLPLGGKENHKKV